jgi:hypothetical protein
MGVTLLLSTLRKQLIRENLLNCRKCVNVIANTKSSLDSSLVSSLQLFTSLLATCFTLVILLH